MNTEEIRGMLTGGLPWSPTADQQKAISHLAAFHVSRKQYPLYLLKGYAGTGKTTLVSVYVNLLRKQHVPFALLAPTGRAAKVLSLYTGYRAHTIHRYIYQVFTAPDGSYRLTLVKNRLSNAVFLVDEASMISDGIQPEDALFSKRNLLEDLLSFVYEGKNNKLILIGDTAQLPPVGLSISPALDLNYINTMKSLASYSFEMKDVMRQSAESGVLATATALRNKIGEAPVSPPFFETALFRDDIIRISDSSELEEILQDSFSAGGLTNGVVVCRSNKRANLFNRQIRNRILQRENRIEGGDLLMVVRNNYFWLGESAMAGFIANGDMIHVVRVLGTEDKFGFTFADVEIELADYPEEKEFTVKLLLDTIDSESSGLPENERQRLWREMESEYGHISQRRKRNQAIQEDPYFNALHVKFAYAMTCHKTQGGQWETVIVDQGYVNDQLLDNEYLRWLYTAVTRSITRLYLVNFNPEFFSD